VIYTSKEVQRKRREKDKEAARLNRLGKKKRRIEKEGKKKRKWGQKKKTKVNLLV